MRLNEGTAETPAWVDIQTRRHCDVRHERDELRDAVAFLVVDCPTCVVVWTVAVCGGHATTVALLKSLGDGVNCPDFCGTDVPADRIELEDM